MGIRNGKQLDEPLNTTPLLEPDERRMAITEARDIMIVLGDRLPAEVEEWLSWRTKPQSVEVLCPDTSHCRNESGLCDDFPDAGYLLGLLEQGYVLFDALVPRETLVFLDHRQCYRLPAWDPVPDSFSLACDLLWRRNGYYAHLVGTVIEIAPGGRMFKLSVNEYYWTWITLPDGCQVPALDSRVKVLGISSWIGGTTAHLIHGVLVINLGEA